MVLSDRDIRSELAANRLRIEPFDDSNVQPASVDLRLGHQFLTFEGHTMPLIDVKQDMHYLMSPVEIDEEHPFVLEPRQFVLAVTLEYVELPDDLVGRLDGKSSLGRLGLVVALDGGVRGPRLEGEPDAGAEQPGASSHPPLLRHEGVPDLLHPPLQPGGAALRVEGTAQQVPGPEGAHGQPLLPGLRRGVTRTGPAAREPPASHGADRASAVACRERVRGRRWGASPSTWV